MGRAKRNPSQMAAGCGMMLDFVEGHDVLHFGMAAVWASNNNYGICNFNFLPQSLPI
jgi:hypothetical protein